MRRWAGIAGILFVILAVLSRLVEGRRPDTNAKDAIRKLTRYYAKTSHLNHGLVAVILGLIGMFFFLWFLAGLWSALRAAEGAATMRTGAILAGGSVFAAVGGLAHEFGNVVGDALKFSDAYKLDANSAIVLDRIAHGAFALAMIAVGVTTAAAGLVILRTRILPAWLAWSGFLIALLALPVVGLLTAVSAGLLAIWVVATSIFMLTGRLTGAEGPVASA